MRLPPPSTSPRTVPAPGRIMICMGRPLKVDSVVPDHLACLRCGYDLFHQDYDGRCPECGLGVAQSEPTVGLAEADPHWLARLARASAWLAISLKLQPWALIANTITWALLAPLVPGVVALFYGTLVVMCASVVAVWLGVVLFTAPDAPRLFALRLAPYRLRARWCACVLAMVWVAAWVALALWRHTAAFHWVQGLFTFFAALVVVGFDALLALAARIVALARARWVEQDVQRLRRGTLAATCTFALASTVAAVASSSRLYPQLGMLLYLLLVSVGAVGLSLWWARLGDHFRHITQVLARTHRAALRARSV